MSVPLVIYDWTKDSHSALELPTAVTAWLFGLDHFARNDYHWWPIVIGMAFLLAYWGLTGLAFAGIADRVSAYAGWRAAWLSAWSGAWRAFCSSGTCCYRSRVTARPSG
jgi:hypothetical protein